MPEDLYSHFNPSGPAPFAPPHNIEAEQALLGALLFDNSVHMAVGDWLLAEHFYDPLHGRIYEIVAGLITSGQLADAIVLKTKFSGHAGLAELDDPDSGYRGWMYLADLMREAPEPSSAVEYGRLIHDLALRRALVEVCRTAEADALRSVDTEPAVKALERAEGALYALAERGPQAGKGVVRFEDAMDAALAQARAAYEKGDGITGLPTGLSSLDRKLGGLHRSDLIILAGRPSMGKTALATNIAFSLARAHAASDGAAVGAPVAFFSLEMSEDQLALRMASDWSGVSSFLIREGRIDARQMRQVEEAMAEIRHLPIHIDPTGGISVEQLCARARRLKRQHGIALVVIDYIQLLTTARRIDGRVQEISYITQTLKALAKELDAPVLALSQLSRQVENREDKRPQLSDLRESGSIEQDADVVMFAYRESYYLERLEPKAGSEEHLTWEDAMRQCARQADIILGKQRHGPIGSVKVAFDPDRTRFSDLSDTAEYEHV